MPPTIALRGAWLDYGLFGQLAKFCIGSMKVQDRNKCLFLNASDECLNCICGDAGAIVDLDHCIRLGSADQVCRHVLCRDRLCTYERLFGGQQGHLVLE
jgi:hypothetical protein